MSERSGSFYPTEDRVFLDTMDDLYHRASPRGTAYDAIQTTGLIRRLINDGSASLAEKAKRRFRIKYEFTLRQSFWYIGDGIWSAGALIDPELAEAQEALGYLDLVAPEDREFVKAAAPQSIKTVNKDRFLSFPIGIVDGNEMSVHRLLDAYAFGFGGVHHDEAKVRRKDPEIVRMIEAHEQSALDAVSTLGRVVHRALAPLAACVHWSASDYVIPALKR